MSLRVFFEDDAGRLSMSRLLCFLAFWPATYVVLAAPSVDTLAVYLGAYVLGYLGGKLGARRREGVSE